MALAVAARPSSASVIFMVVVVFVVFCEAVVCWLWWLANLARYSWKYLTFHIHIETSFLINIYNLVTSRTVVFT